MMSVVKSVVYETDFNSDMNRVKDAQRHVMLRVVGQEWSARATVIT